MNNYNGFKFTFDSFKRKTISNNLQQNRQNVQYRQNGQNIQNKQINIVNKNMEWGTVTWILFHWLAANINEDFYQRSSGQLHGIVLNIMYNLPCPTCKQHAIDFSKKYDIKTAKTKSQLIQYFYFFHNRVNDRKNITNPNRSILNNYTKMNGVDVINNWYKKFKNNLGINMNDFMNKQNIAQAKEMMIRFITSNRSQFSNL